MYMEHQEYIVKQKQLIQDSMRAINGEEWSKFMYGSLPTHKHQIVLCKVQAQQEIY